MNHDTIVGALWALGIVTLGPAFILLLIKVALGTLEILHEQRNESRKVEP